MFKLISKIFHILLVAGFLAMNNAAHATVTTFYFGSLLSASSGYQAPNNFASQPFASLETVNNGSVWTFTLSVNNNLFKNFGDKAYIGSMSFDFNPDPVNQPVSSFIGSNVGGVSSVASTNGGATYGLSDIDFGTQFGKGSSNRLAQNDYVSWSVSGLSGTKFVNMYIDVKGIGGGYSAKYTPQGVTAEQLAALNAEAVRTKSEADRIRLDHASTSAEREHADAVAVEAERLRAETQQKKDDEEVFRRKVIARDNDSGYGGGSSCVSLVPEPETYAMLLAGLGLIGFAARRKK